MLKLYTYLTDQQINIDIQLLVCYVRIIYSLMQKDGTYEV